MNQTQDSNSLNRLFNLLEISMFFSRSQIRQSISNHLHQAAMLFVDIGAGSSNGHAMTIKSATH